MSTAPDDAGAPPAAPDWSAGTLGSVLPATARALGVRLRGPAASAPDPFAFPSARRAVVVLVDGMGERLLRRRGGHAPFLRSLLSTGASVPCGFPSTTATSMGSFGTGLPPGAHGLVGYTAYDPQAGRVFNELSWEDGPDPFAWQPFETVLQQAEAAGVAVTRIGPRYFDGSGLTNAALRGGRFVAGWELSTRVDAAVQAVRARDRALVYLYWGDLDRKGHEHGVDSVEWVEELELVDAALADLSRRLPEDTLLVVTADHGMVDVPFEDRLELLARPELMDAVVHLSGEPRSLGLHVADGMVQQVRSAWAQQLGARADLLTREELLDLGWFTHVRPEVLDRLPDLMVMCRERFAVVHSGQMRLEVLRLLGVHGGTTLDELAVPVLHRGPR